VASLFGQAPTAQVYATINLPGGNVQVVGGDGVEGATFPTGQNNLQASYRVGIGASGNVPAGAISTLVDRPVGVSSVTNPTAATGGQDPATAADIRTSAPLSATTLGRVVSLADYQNFAATFAGIAKASAVWVSGGGSRGVFVTVAASGGSELPAGNLTLENLVKALQNCGNPNVAVDVASFLETTFGFEADLLYDPAYVADDVQAAVLAMLQTTYSFTARTFGQGVSSDEIAALIQAVPGIIAVDVKKVRVVATSPAGDIGSGGYSLAAYRTWIARQLTLPRRHEHSHRQICPYVPVATGGTPPSPGEILVLDPNPANVKLGVMS
jgi:predicted phage baseplate assembly protein